MDAATAPAATRYPITKLVPTGPALTTTGAAMDLNDVGTGAP